MPRFHDEDVRQNLNRKIDNKSFENMAKFKCLKKTLTNYMQNEI